MIIEKDLQVLYKKLLFESRLKVHLGGSDIQVRLLNRDEKIALDSQVYDGGNFIPHSVRRCLNGKIPFKSHISTQLIVDEDNFQIYLTFLGNSNEYSSKNFSHLMEEFSWQADEWRLYLDDHDKEDLVHVYAR